jgi:dihydrofolate synthase/folylpolyglutamate synthase
LPGDCSDLPQAGLSVAYIQAEEFLLSLVNYEKQPPPMCADTEGWHLREFSRMLTGMGHPERAFPILHVAGTKGKGSTTRFLSTLLMAQGYKRVGSFTSPHIEWFRERIALNNQPVSEAAFVDALEAARAVLPQHPSEGFRTTFEVLTAMALDFFRRERCEAVVLETGLGGRLDCTNVATARLALITAIGFDHQKVLGKTLGQIVREKAGIIKPGTGVALVGPQPLGRMRVVGRVAREQAAAAGVPLEIYDARRDPIRRAEASERGFELDVVVGISSPRALAPRGKAPSVLSPLSSVLSPQSSALSTQSSVLSPQSSVLSPQSSALSTQSSVLSPQSSVLSPQSSALSTQHSALLRGVVFPMLGRHQLDNLRAALMALEAFARLEGRAVDPKGVRRGIEACGVPGRLEVVRWEPPVLLDGAHCPLSARAAGQACAEHFPGRDMILVLGMMADKKIEAILSNLRRFGGAAQVFAYTAPSPRACGEEKLAKLARRHFPWVETCGTMEKALEHALAAQSRRPGALVLCTGTFYGIAQARRYLVSHGRTPTNTDEQG